MLYDVYVLVSIISCVCFVVVYGLMVYRCACLYV